MAARLTSMPARRPSARGLVAAWGVVLGLSAVSGAIVFGLLREAPQVAPPAEAASAPPPRTASLKLPHSDFRVLPAAEREAMIEPTADGLRLPRISPAGWMPWIAYSRRYPPE